MYALAQTVPHFRILHYLAQATRTEQLVQDKEKKYAEEQRLIMRKRELTDVIAHCAAEEKKVRLNTYSDHQIRCDDLCSQYCFSYKNSLLL